MPRRICTELVENQRNGPLRPYSTSVRVPGHGRCGGPILHATSLVDARKTAKTFKVQPLSIQGELGFEVDTDGNVLLAGFHAEDKIS
ncbi:MAG TPA: hypothetical protein VG815_08150, partial [Chloroflexota bacterium]|nr:hypothetical protein [Chloroflexota bacterium]